MDQIEFLEGLIARFDAQIEEAMAPFAAAAERLRGIPGVAQQAAEVIVAELGTDMAQFPTAGHLGSWAGLCPGNNESAGKRRTREDDQGESVAADDVGAGGMGGQPHQGDDLQRRYHRWAKRLGKKKALVAVAHKILVVIWCLLRRQSEYQERWKPLQPA